MCGHHLCKLPNTFKQISLTHIICVAIHLIKIFQEISFLSKLMVLIWIFCNLKSVTVKLTCINHTKILNNILYINWKCIKVFIDSVLIFCQIQISVLTFKVTLTNLNCCNIHLFWSVNILRFLTFDKYQLISVVIILYKIVWTSFMQIPNTFTQISLTFVFNL